MPVKITEIARLKEHTRRDKNSAGEWVESTYSYKYFESPPYISGTRRIVHRIIDILMIHVCFILMFFSIAFLVNFLVELSSFLSNYADMSDTAFGLIVLLFYFFSSFFYYVFFEGIFGRTVGHMITGAMVLNIYGKKPTLRQVLIRSIARYTPLDSISGLEPRAWHDQWSNTVVVHKKQYQAFVFKLALDDIIIGEDKRVDV